MTTALKPNLARCVWTSVLFAVIAMLVAASVRQIVGMDPVMQWSTLVTVAYIFGAVGFVVGIGGFDYWWPWIIGKDIDPHDHSQHGAYSWRDYFKFNTDHKVIGVQYIVFTFMMFLVGGMFAEIFRSELASPGRQLLSDEQYNALISQHGTIMIFVFMVPVFAGIGNYVIPLMIGAPDMAFPRVNAVSFWLLPIAAFTLLSSFAFGSFDTGWTGYPTLSEQSPFGGTLFQIGVIIAGSSSIATAVNFLVTIVAMRAPGMTLFRMPLLVWANLATSALVVAATPFVAGAMFMAMFDREMGTNFFTIAGGGSAIAYQHIFWFYSHPAVYIMVLPGFGIISEVIATHSRKPVFGYRAVAFSSAGIAVLGFSVWAHHMFASGMASWLRVPIMISTLLIAIPTGIKIFSWLGTLWDGVVRLTTANLFALGFIVAFTIGGLSGVMLAVVPFDVSITNSYFIVAHFHYVLFGGSILTIFAGFYHWFPKVTGRMYNEKLGRWHFWVTFIALNLTFFPMHYQGLMGMPRRVADYAPEFGWSNTLITISSFFLAAGMLIFVYNMIHSARHGKPAGANPWGGLTLEWMLSSPPPVFNFPVTPRVIGGPYRFGEEGARHAIIPDAQPAETEKVGA
ncbi:MAG: cbb3-type cytochrome c oxidase subunit I [Actinomycetota bacterium]